MLLACLSAAADNFVWNYKHTKHCPVAGICSQPEFISGNEMAMGVYVGHTDRDVAYCKIIKATSDFREGQRYIMVAFDFGEAVKFAVSPFPGGDTSLFLVDDVPSLLEHLRSASQFTVTVPVAGNGATTFFFDTAGYPLAWP